MNRLQGNSCILVFEKIEHNISDSKFKSKAPNDSILGGCGK